MTGQAGGFKDLSAAHQVGIPLKKNSVVTMNSVRSVVCFVKNFQPTVIKPQYL